MKTFSLVLLAAFFLVGCHSHYDLTLNNGTEIKGVSKPILDKQHGVYRFKLANGVVQQVPAIRVIAISAK